MTNELWRLKVLNDFEMIVHELPSDLEYINLYPIGDVHVGSADFDLEHWNYWKKMVENDPKGYVVLVGDLVDNGLKTSKTNSYHATMRPREQKEWLRKELEPLKNRILGGVQGNHERRSNDLSDDCPMYDVMAKLDLEHLYRENMCFIKINVGYKNRMRQYSYNIVLGHGASRNKVNNFSYSIDGLDVIITGHTHQASSSFPSKIVIDPRNNVVRMEDFVQLVVPSFQKLGGYALNAMYMPQSSRKIPVVRLYGNKKGVTCIWK